MDNISDLLNSAGVISAAVISLIALFTSRSQQKSQQKATIMATKRSERIDKMREYSADIISCCNRIIRGNEDLEVKEELICHVDQFNSLLQYVYPFDIDLIERAKKLVKLSFATPLPRADLKHELSEFWLECDLYIGVEYERLKDESIGKVKASGAVKDQEDDFMMNRKKLLIKRIEALKTRSGIMRSTEEFCKTLNLPQKITNDIIALENKVSANLGSKILVLATQAMRDDITQDEFLQLLKAATDHGKEIDEHEFRMQMIFSYYCFAMLEQKYRQAGISPSVYEDTIQDFRFRVEECNEVYRFNGIFVAWWYRIFCNMALHKLGALEFEKTTAGFDYCGKGVTVSAGDPIVAMHIPPKTNINRQNITDALKAAYRHYGFHGKVAFQCDSWLLYPDFENVFVAGGNIMEFRSFFHILSHKDNPEFEDCWRVFKVGKITDLNALPTQTRLQKNMLAHLRSNGKTGDALGVLVFDGENIL